METLHQFRLRCLPQAAPSAWSMEMIDEAPSLWLEAMKACYDSLIASPYLFGAVTQKTELIALPLEADGRFNRNHQVRMASGQDGRSPVMNGEQTGWCAERKLLENDFPEALVSFLGRHDIWLFYITRSPCFYCSNAILAALNEQRLKHVVVAFESFYGSPADPYSKPSDGFLQRVKLGYNSRDLGIELFKVYRSEGDTDYWRQVEQTALLPAGAQPERVVYRLRLGVTEQGELNRVRSRRRNDTVAGVLGRDTRIISDVRATVGGQTVDLAVISGEIKDPLSCDDPTLRFRRLIRLRT